MKKIVLMAFAVVLTTLSLACGGGSVDDGPSARFRSVLTGQLAYAGQKVLLDAVLSDVSDAVTWTFFYDMDTDPANGRSDVGSGTGRAALGLWDTTGVAPGTYHVGISFSASGETYEQYAPATVEVDDGVAPTLSLDEPSVPQQYTVGEDILIEASTTNFADFKWTVVASLSKNPVLPDFTVTQQPYSQNLSYTWDTSGRLPGSFYLGVAARKGDVLMYEFTAFLITLVVHDMWVEMSTDGAPSPRYDHDAVWTGNEMFVWGGRDNVNYFATGGVYTPWADAWTATSLVNAPSGRTGFSMTWCGDRAIVWGGFANGSYLDDGAAYFPASDTWVPISSQNAPAARADHRAVWTGTFLIVWGGEASSTTLNDGGIYDPATDTWTALEGANRPSARKNHGMAWVDTGLIVWGGVSFNALSDGYFYEFASDEWSEISSTNAPNARFDHHCAYLPARGMVVCGGEDGFGPLADGGAYDPVSDTWNPIPAAGAPDAYFDSSVELAGQYVFSWGGFNNGFSFDGGLYDLNTGTWRDVTDENSPEGRSEASSVWTGSVIIIWSGKVSGGYTDTGFYYFP